MRISDWSSDVFSSDLQPSFAKDRMEGEIVVRMRRGERTTPGKGVVCQNDIPRPPLFRRDIVLEDGLEAVAHGVELDRWPRLLRQPLTLPLAEDRTTAEQRPRVSLPFNPDHRPLPT